MGIYAEIDGVWCNSCKQFHPTLMWHEKYNNYLLDRKEKWEKMIKKHFPDENVKYIDKIIALGLDEDKDIHKCIICESDTNFKNVKTGNFVCCDKCKYEDLGIK